jgi:hypothetical protein
MSVAATYQEGVTRLNACKLEPLLMLSCLLSAVELNTSPDERIFPLLNQEKTRLLADAIIASSAQSYKVQHLSEKDFVYVLNALSQGLDDPRLRIELPSGADRDRLHYGTMKFFARMASIQIRTQNAPFKMHVGRAVAMFQVFPTSCTAEFPSAVRELASRIPNVIAEKLGASVLELALSHLAVVLWYVRLNELVWRGVEAERRPVDSRVYLDPEGKRADTLQAVIRAGHQLQARIVSLRRLSAPSRIMFCRSMRSSLFSQYRREVLGN